MVVKRNPICFLIPHDRMSKFTFTEPKHVLLVFENIYQQHKTFDARIVNMGSTDLYLDRL